MKRRRVFVAIVIGTIVVARSLPAQNDNVPHEVRDPKLVFTERVIVVKGTGVAPSNRPLSGGQKELLALRAAKVVALRELAEVLSGVRISGETCVQDAAASSDQVKATVNGLVKGAEVIHEAYDEHTEVGTVYVQLHLDGPDGLTQSLLPEL
ncbi:MAG TPA: hypothetical protein VL403_20070, partial [Candidatus Kryptonia bacterium]|nr:hypothetical protein [Candidatus Kryptonia bacterium]